MSVLDHLRQRGFVQQCTDADGLARALDLRPIVYYVGFDPTADSLHVGHLLPIMAMAWLQRAGHKPIVVLGGGTGMVGDPSGKDRSRDLLTSETVAANLAAQKPQFARFLDAPRTTFVDNAEWLAPLRYIDFLRDIGRHFSVNKMLSAEGVRQRLDRGQGLSFIEFNYHLLQSADFLVLHRRFQCSLQMGGDDQWFNILGGVDLIRRETGAEAFGLTFPLLTTAAGKKMGKTEAGAVWLDPKRVTPYDYFQYWLNVDDRDVGRLLRLYTFLPMEEIARLDRLEGAEIREAKRVLAREATALAHGPAEADAADAAARAAFSGGVSEDMPTYATAFPVPLLDVLCGSGLAASRSEARRLVQQGGVRVGDERIADLSRNVDAECIVWAGKKKAVRVVRS